MELSLLFDLEIESRVFDSELSLVFDLELSLVLDQELSLGIDSRV